MKCRIHILALAAVLLLGTLPAQARETGFAPIRVYEEQFSDVSQGDWYYETVKALYELGLANGREDGRYDPHGDLTGGEVVTMAARLRSLYETGDSETGPAAYGGDGGVWYQPYVSYLQEKGAIGRELEDAYNRPATRAEMAHVLANALPDSLFTPVNGEVVAAGYEAGQYITDVTESMPYREDILKLYTWGVAGGSDQTGSFQPEENISRCQAAALAARLAYGELRLALDWEILPAYSRKGTTMADLVDSDGSFYESPAPAEWDKIDADVRYMLSRGERTIRLQYPAGTLTRSYADDLNRVFLEVARNYVEQTYNYVHISYSSSAGFATLTFASSLYSEDDVDYYREETMACALAVHDQMWESGKITADMTEYEKAKAYYTWICENCRYDHTSAAMSHTGYRLFKEKLAVCDGYTAAYNLLLKLEGIHCGTYSTADHIWTTATLDGQAYHIDTTWGDQDYGVEYRYFAMTESYAAARFA